MLKEQLDVTLSMLKNASPNEIDDEEETICAMENTAKEMGSMIEKRILGCDQKKDDLSDVNEKFLQALSMYQQLMKEPMSAPQPPPPAYQTSPPASLQYHQSNQYVSVILKPIFLTYILNNMFILYIMCSIIYKLIQIRIVIITFSYGLSTSGESNL